MQTRTRFAWSVFALAAGLGLSASSAQAAFVTWQSRAHTGDITADTPSHPHTSAGYVDAWNAIAGNAPSGGTGDGGFDDWTNKNNQTAVTGGGNGNYGLHAFFSFEVAANNTGNWTFNIGNDADFGGTVLLDGTELGTNAGGYYPNGPSGSRVLAAGIHTIDVYSFEACCDGPGTSTFIDPLSGVPRTVNSTNLQVPEPTTAALAGLASAGLLLRRRRGSLV